MLRRDQLPSVRTWLADVAAPLAAWLVVAAVAAAGIAYGLSAEHRRIWEAFQGQVGDTADGFADQVETHQRLLGARAVELLAGETLSSPDLRTLVTGLGFESGAVFDDRGRYLTSTMFREEAVGQDFTQTLEHVQVAVSQGRPATSQAVVSPNLGTAAIGIAAPYQTPYGRRIVTGVLTLRGGALGDLVFSPARVCRMRARTCSTVTATSWRVPGGTCQGN